MTDYTKEVLEKAEDLTDENWAALVKQRGEKSAVYTEAMGKATQVARTKFIEDTQLASDYAYYLSDRSLQIADDEWLTDDTIFLRAEILYATLIGLYSRDSITVEQYEALTQPWRKVIGPIHPEDVDVFQKGWLY